MQVSEGLNTHIKPLEWVYAQPSINWTEVQDYAAYVQHDKSRADGEKEGQEGEGEGEQLKKKLEPMPQTYKFLDLLNKGPGDGIVQYTPWCAQQRLQLAVGCFRSSGCDIAQMSRSLLEALTDMRYFCRILQKSAWE